MTVPCATSLLFALELKTNGPILINDYTVTHININYCITCTNEYVACFSSELLGATFSVCFKDNIMGTMALHSFSKMLESTYDKQRIAFELCEEQARFHSRDLLEAMTGARVQRPMVRSGDRG